jgi:hypothetical protein
MDQVLGALSVIGAFMLRLGVPVAITIGAVHLFRRLDIRWQTQDWQHWTARLEAAGGVTARKWLSRLANRCWDENSCEPSAVAKCSAHAHQSIPCWMARRAAEGLLPAKCHQCERYTMGALVSMG